MQIVDRDVVLRTGSHDPTRRAIPFLHVNIHLHLWTCDIDDELEDDATLHLGPCIWATFD